MRCHIFQKREQVRTVQRKPLLEKKIRIHFQNIFKWESIRVHDNHDRIFRSSMIFNINTRKAKNLWYFGNSLYLNCWKLGRYLNKSEFLKSWLLRLWAMGTHGTMFFSWPVEIVIWLSILDDLRQYMDISLGGLTYRRNWEPFTNSGHDFHHYQG